MTTGLLSSCEKIGPILSNFLKMTKEDHLRSADYTMAFAQSHLRDDNPITEERWSEYKRLFTKLHLAGGVKDNTLGQIYFDVDPPSLWNGARTKGLVHSSSVLGPLRSDLDGYRMPKEREMYKRISNEWYIFLSAE